MKGGVWIVAGAESFLKDRHARSLCDKRRGWDAVRIEGKGLSLSGVACEAEECSIFGGGRIVEVVGADRATDSSGRGVERIRRLAAAAPDDILLILRTSDVAWTGPGSDDWKKKQEQKRQESADVDEKKRQKRPALHELDEATGVRVTAFEPFREYDERGLTRWIVNEGRAAGHDVAEDAAQELRVRCGTDLRLLCGEIQKLSLFVGAGNSVSLADVRAVVGHTALCRPFDVAEAAFVGNAGKALALIDDLSRTESDPWVGVVAAFASHAEKLLVLLDMVNAGADDRSIATALRTHPYVVGHVMKPAAAKKTMTEAVAAFRAACDVDAVLRTSVASRRALVEKLAIDIAGKARHV